MSKLEDILAHWKTALTSFVAVLIVVPSVINSVNDIWVAWQGLPIGKKEKINALLFEEHWKEDPVHSKQLIIEGKKGKHPVTVDIYRNGDIFIDYVSFTQWFPYKDILATTDNFSILSSAHAGFFSDISRSIHDVGSKAKVINQDAGKNVIREKQFTDGSIERKVINRNTGEVQSVERVPSPDILTPDTPKAGLNSEAIEVIKLPEGNSSRVNVYSISVNPEINQNQVNINNESIPVKPVPAEPILVFEELSTEEIELDQVSFNDNSVSETNEQEKLSVADKIYRDPNGYFRIKLIDDFKLVYRKVFNQSGNHSGNPSSLLAMFSNGRSYLLLNVTFIHPDRNNECLPDFMSSTVSLDHFFKQSIPKPAFVTELEAQNYIEKLIESSELNELPITTDNTKRFILKMKLEEGRYIEAESTSIYSKGYIETLSLTYRSEEEKIKTQKFAKTLSIGLISFYPINNFVSCERI